MSSPLPQHPEEDFRKVSRAFVFQAIALMDREIRDGKGIPCAYISPTFVELVRKTLAVDRENAMEYMCHDFPKGEMKGILWLTDFQFGSVKRLFQAAGVEVKFGAIDGRWALAMHNPMLRYALQPAMQPWVPQWAIDSVPGLKEAVEKMQVE